MRCSSLTDLRIGEDVDQHRRHVGRDHARALGDAGDLDHPAFALHGCCGTFREGVGGHDRLGGHFNRVFRQRGSEVRDSGGDPLMGQRFADHAGGGGKDAGWPEPPAPRPRPR
jgi:hypothetical protein